MVTAFRKISTSFVIAVALVPPMLDRLFELLALVVPAWQTFVGLALLAGAFAARAIWQERQDRRVLISLQPMAQPVHDLNRIHTLVCTANLPDTPAREEAVHTAVRNLPNLERVFLILSTRSSSAADEAKARVRQFVADLGRPVEVDLLLMIAPSEITPVDLEQASLALAALARRHDDAVVDVTGGRVPMSLAAYQAAVEQDLPVVYQVTSGTQHDFHGLTAVHDPGGSLSLPTTQGAAA